jgi:hypothetical protein
VQVTLEYSEKYRKTFPDDSENKILNSIEDEKDNERRQKRAACG